jgi:hypothetical protein
VQDAQVRQQLPALNSTRPAAWLIPSSRFSLPSLSYLHHLLKAKEPLAATLLSIHNIHFMVQLMVGLRSDILEGKM